MPITAAAASPRSRKRRLGSLLPLLLLSIFIVCNVFWWHHPLAVSLVRPGISSNASCTLLVTTPFNRTTELADVHSTVDDNTAKPILFGLHPQSMTETFASCAARKRCHILYWHIQKTGGTNLADRLYFMNGQRYDSRYWCCNDDFMKSKFRPNPSEHCQKVMGVYEVRPSHFMEVMETCSRLGNISSTDSKVSLKETNTEDTFVALVTIRQPLERTVSAIHQHCNVHPNHTDPKTQGICNRCNYNVETDRWFYDKFTNTTNTIYHGIQENLRKAVSLNIPMLLLDNDDMDAFLEGVERIATESMHESGSLPLNETFHFKWGRSNSQHDYTDKVCDFGMTGAMMKQHVSSLRTYRWIQQEGWSIASGM